MKNGKDKHMVSNQKKTMRLKKQKHEAYERYYFGNNKKKAKAKERARVFRAENRDLATYNDERSMARNYIKKFANKEELLAIKEILDKIQEGYESEGANSEEQEND